MAVVQDRRSAPGRTWPTIGDVAAALDAGAEDRRPGDRAGSPRSGSGAKRWMATPLIAAVRAAVIGPPSRIASGTPVAGSLRTTVALDRRQAQGAVGRVADDPLHPEQVVAPVRIAAAQEGRHRVAERGRRAGVDGDLRRQLGRAVGQGDERPLGQPEPLVERRQRRRRRRPPTGSGGGLRLTRQSTSRAAPGTPLPSRPWPRSTPPRASTTSSSSATRSSCTTRSRRSSGTRVGPPAFRTIAGNERRHAEIWATKLRELGADVPPPRPAAAPGPGDHLARPAARDPGGQRPGPGPRGRRGGHLRGPGLARGRWRSPPTSASTPRSGSGSTATPPTPVAPSDDVRAATVRAERGRRTRSVATSAGTGPASRGRSGRSSSGSATGS